jgi:hypothetical protein
MYLCPEDAKKQVDRLCRKKPRKLTTVNPLIDLSRTGIDKKTENSGKMLRSEWKDCAGKNPEY